VTLNDPERPFDASDGSVPVSRLFKEDIIIIIIITLFAQRTQRNKQ